MLKNIKQKNKTKTYRSLVAKHEFHSVEREVLSIQANKSILSVSDVNDCVEERAEEPEEKNEMINRYTRMISSSEENVDSFDCVEW